MATISSISFSIAPFTFPSKSPQKISLVCKQSAPLHRKKTHRKNEPGHAKTGLEILSDGVQNNRGQAGRTPVLPRADGILRLS